MSCKQLLGVVHSIHLQVPDPAAHRASWHRKAFDLELNPCKCTLLTDLLKRFKPKDAQGRASRAWTLCVDCQKYRPTRRAYWSSILAKMDTQGWGKTEGDLWQSAMTWFAAGIKLQCPLCRMREAEIEEAD
ncbi:hypothetical protein HJFPF1_07787 [Paramyrothecium foliicola]|nr:hypothetical protein HJFPF1_07787 [Paramyrothecium foliicola]